MILPPATSKFEEQKQKSLGFPLAQSAMGQHITSTQADEVEEVSGGKHCEIS